MNNSKESKLKRFKDRKRRQRSQELKLNKCKKWWKRSSNNKNRNRIVTQTKSQKAESRVINSLLLNYSNHTINLFNLQIKVNSLSIFTKQTKKLIFRIKFLIVSRSFSPQIQKDHPQSLELLLRSSAKALTSQTLQKRTEWLEIKK